MRRGIQGRVTPPYMARERLGDSLRDAAEALVDVALARDEVATAIHAGDRAEAVELDLEEPLGIVEGRLEHGFHAGQGLGSEDYRAFFAERAA